MASLTATRVLSWILGACLPLAAVSCQQGEAPATTAPGDAQFTTPKNLILFIADGFGPATRTMARTAHGKPLHIDSILVGSVGTASSSSLVTDSAASATAYACGVRTYNGAIGLDAQGEPRETLLEIAKKKGLRTGLVSTARMTHATPASFSAHVANRGMEQPIADQQIEQGIDLLLGGGSRFYLPQEAGGRRQDDKNLFELAEEKGYVVIRERAAFDASRQLPLLGLFTDSHMAYEIDRDPELEPSLAEMTARAIELLSDGDEGFFLMVEAGRIDHAGHANDSAAHLHDTLAFDEAIGVALEYVAQSKDTLLVSVADHETGGLTLGRNENNQGIYNWKPEFVMGLKKSLDGLILAMAEGRTAADVLAEYAGIDELSEAEQADLNTVEEVAERDRTRALSQALSRILSQRALTGWTTWGHTGVDIGLFASGPGSRRFAGHHENYAVGLELFEVMGWRNQ